jgi:hypothetical protein
MGRHAGDLQGIWVAPDWPDMRRHLRTGIQVGSSWQFKLRGKYTFIQQSLNTAAR